MDFLHPPILARPLQHKYRTLKALTSDDPNKDGGQFNAGIFLVERRFDKKKFIEKRLRPEEIENGLADFEMSVLRSLKHESVTRYVDAFLDQQTISPSASIFMEHCDAGTLDDILERCISSRRRLPERTVWTIFKQLINAIGYCHSGSKDVVMGFPRELVWGAVLHRDIKPANVFLSSVHNRPGYYRVILGDFGRAIRKINCPSCYEDRLFLNGDRNWTAPETPRFGQRSDIWGVGAVIQAICRLDGPPATLGPETGEGRRCRGTGERYSNELNTALSTIMRTNARDRPNTLEFGPVFQGLRNAAGNPAPTFPSWAFGHG